MLDNFRAVSELLVNSQTKHPLQIVKFCVIPDSSREANSQVISTNTIKAMYFSSYYLLSVVILCAYICAQFNFQCLYPVRLLCSVNKLNIEDNQQYSNSTYYLWCRVRIIQ